MKIDISIIIPFYNSIDYLASCILCLEEQSFQGTEIIMIDDGSTDDGFKIVLEFQEKFQNIILIRHENCGQGLSRNEGIRIARGNYIYFLDSDDLIEKCVLEKLISIANVSEADMIMFDSINVSSSVENLSNIDEILAEKALPSLYSIRNLEVGRNYSGIEFIVSALNTNSMFPVVWLSLIKRSLLIENNIRFMDIIHEDNVFMMNACIASESIIYSGILGHYRRIVTGSIMHQRKTKKHVEGAIVAMRHASEVYKRIGVSKCNRKALFNWNLLNTGLVLGELRNSGLKKEYKLKFLLYVLRHPYMTNIRMLYRIITL